MLKIVSEYDQEIPQSQSQLLNPQRGLKADNAAIYHPSQIGIRQIRIAIPHIFCMCIIKKPFGLNVYANSFLRIW